MTLHDDTSPAPEEHPSADQLAGFAEGSLPLADEHRVRRHLEVCPECDSLIRDLSSYPNLESETEAYHVDDEELRTTLGTLRTRVLGTTPDDQASHVAFEKPGPEAREKQSQAAVLVSAIEGSTTAPPSSRSRTVDDSRRWQTFLAAAMVLLALGWGWQRGSGSKRLEAEVTELRQQLSVAEGALKKPWVNVKVARLLAGDDHLRGSPAPILSLARTGNTVLIQTPDPLSSGQYTGEVRGPDGEVVLRIEGLEPRPIGLSFFLPVAALEPGDYQLWLLQDKSEVYPTPFELRVSE